MPSSQSKDRCNTGTTMSRAFVKEDENDTAELPGRPISPHRNFVTERGLRRLRPLLPVSRRRTAPQQTKATGKPPPLLCGSSVTGERGARALKSSNPRMTKARHPSA
jgi:hypothetical protein